MKDGIPLPQRLIGGEDGRAAAQVAGIDNSVEDVGSVLGVGEITLFVEDQNLGRDPWLRLGLELPPHCRCSEGAASGRISGCPSCLLAVDGPSTLNGV